jgi:hypothetical protein
MLSLYSYATYAIVAANSVTHSFGFSCKGTDIFFGFERNLKILDRLS